MRSTPVAQSRQTPTPRVPATPWQLRPYPSSLRARLTQSTKETIRMHARNPARTRKHAKGVNQPKPGATPLDRHTPPRQP